MFLTAAVSPWPGGFYKASSEEMVVKKKSIFEDATLKTLWRQAAVQPASCNLSVMSSAPGAI